MSLFSTVSKILAAGEGGSSVFNGGEESSVSSSTNETHSSLNSEVQEEELVYSREPSTEPPESCSSDNYPSGTQRCFFINHVSGLFSCISLKLLQI